MTKKIIINSLIATKKLAEELVKNIQFGTIILLFGDLGSGKTTLSKFIGQALGIKDNIVSPTFTIMQTYPLSQNNLLVHIDTYRLKSIDEFLAIGANDFLNNKNICLIEWPEKILEILPKNLKIIKIKIKVLNNNQRELEIIED